MSPAPVTTTEDSQKIARPRPEDDEEEDDPDDTEVSSPTAAPSTKRRKLNDGSVEATATTKMKPKGGFFCNRDELFVGGLVLVV
mmetsp:Transcript_16527/g.45546  ORF Transcript_16527/g.45546 Transcript_16527/m.45546 type:complete len:84 (+) Transcript_16527:154-405(+)